MRWYLIIREVRVIEGLKGASLADGDGFGLVLESDVGRVLEEGEGPLFAAAEEDGLLPVLDGAVGVVVEDAGDALREGLAALVDVDGGAAGAVDGFNFSLKFLKSEAKQNRQKWLDSCNSPNSKAIFSDIIHCMLKFMHFHWFQKVTWLRSKCRQSTG